MRSIKILGHVLLVCLVVGIIMVGVNAVGQQKTVLKYWHTHGPRTPEAEALQNIISGFEATHPNIEIKAQQIPYDELHRKLIVSIAGGQAPDLVRMDIVWVPEFAHMGALVPLNEEFSDFSGYPELFYEGPLSTCYWKGNYYGLPLSTNTRVLFWNKEMFEAAGISSPPSTYTDFLNVARTLTKDTDGDGDIDQWGVALGGTYPWAILPLFWNAGGAVTDPDITKATGYLNSQESIAALESIVNLYKDGAIAPTIIGAGVGTYEGYAKNQYAMILSGPWGYPILQGQFPEKEIHASLVPAGIDGKSRSVIGGEDIVIFKQSKNKSAAWEFVKYMVTEDSRLKMAKAGILPVLKSLADAQYIKEHDFFPIYLKQMETAKARTPHYNWPQIKDTLTTAFEAAIRGKKSPEQALQDAASKIDNLLNE